MSASESFSRKNINCSVEEGLAKTESVTKAARAASLRVRGYLSCVIGCPYDGPTKPSTVAQIAEKLLGYGCYEVSLGDTIGVGSAGSVRGLLDTLKAAKLPLDHFAVHFHDTYGQALANVVIAIENGINVADSSIAGLGGCPFAAGATGNLATEDLVYMLNDMGFDTGIDLDKLVEVGDWICRQMGRSNSSKVANAILAKRKNNF